MKNFICLLQELLMRCSALNLIDSGDSHWGRPHGHIQTSCTFDSSHSRADTKWRLSVSYILSAECEGSVTQSRTASNSLGAPEDTQTSLNCIYWVIHWLIWSYHKLRLYTDLSLRFLSSSHVELNENEKLELIFSHFQFFNPQIIRTWPQIDMG